MYMYSHKWACYYRTPHNYEIPSWHTSWALQDMCQAYIHCGVSRVFLSLAGWWGGSGSLVGHADVVDWLMLGAWMINI